MKSAALKVSVLVVPSGQHSAIPLLLTQPGVAFKEISVRRLPELVRPPANDEALLVHESLPKFLRHLRRPLKNADPRDTHQVAEKIGPYFQPRLVRCSETGRVTYSVWEVVEQTPLRLKTKLCRAAVDGQPIEDNDLRFDPNPKWALEQYVARGREIAENPALPPRLRDMGTALLEASSEARRLRAIGEHESATRFVMKSVELHEEIATCHAEDVARHGRKFDHRKKPGGPKEKRNRVGIYERATQLSGFPKNRPAQIAFCREKFPIELGRASDEAIDRSLRRALAKTKNMKKLDG